MKAVVIYTTSALLLLALLTIITSCKKEYSYEGRPITNTITSKSELDTTLTDSSIFIDFVLDGRRVFGIENEKAGPYAGGQLWGNALTDTTVFAGDRTGSSFVYTRRSLFYFAFTKGVIDLYKLRYSDSIPGPIPYIAVDTFFQAGNYNYSIHTHDTTYNFNANDSIINGSDSLVTQPLLSRGISIYLIDSTGKSWQTFDGTADQTGSYFTIVENKVYPCLTIPGYSIGNMITVSFACRLYDKSGNMKQITNGKFRLAEWL